MVKNMELKNISIEWLGHSSFRIKAKGKTIYVDPYQVTGKEKADLILITHDHYDHCSMEDIEKITKADTTIIGNSKVAEKLNREVKEIKKGESKEIKGIELEAVPAYNTNKEFHPKGTGLGFLIKTENKTIYHAGDTDFIPEMKNLKGRVDIALLPASGTYVMNAKEAAEAANAIEPKLAIPMHYGSVIGDRSDAEKFAELCKEKTKILKKRE